MIDPFPIHLMVGDSVVFFSTDRSREATYYAPIRKVFNSPKDVVKSILKHPLQWSGDVTYIYLFYIDGNSE